MPKYNVSLEQTVNERLTICVQAHSQEQAEVIAQYIAENGKDPWDRHSISVEFEFDEVLDEPTVYDSEITVAISEQPCNIMPEHTEGLWAKGLAETD